MAINNSNTLVRAQGFFGGSQKDQEFAKQTSRELVKVSNQMLSMQTLLQQNIGSLNDAVIGDSDKQKKLAITIQNLTDIEQTQNKIVTGQELTQKEAKDFVALSSDVVGNLKDLNLQFEVNFADIVSNLKSTLTDTSQDIEDRRKLVQQIRDLAKQKGVDEKTINGLDELLNSNLNFTDEQTKQVEKLVNEVTKDKAFQSKSIATLDQINSSLDASVLTQDELKSLLDKQDQGGKSFSQKFIENPGVFAANNQVKTGALSSVFGAAGLGGIDTALGLSDKLSIEGLAKGFEKAKGFFNKDNKPQSNNIDSKAVLDNAVSNAPVLNNNIDSSIVSDNAVSNTPVLSNSNNIDSSIVSDNAVSNMPVLSNSNNINSSAVLDNAVLNAPVLKEGTKEIDKIAVGIDKIVVGIDKIVENTDVDAKTNTEINKERRKAKVDKEQLAAIKALKPKDTASGALLSQSQIVSNKLNKKDKNKQQNDSSSSSILGDLFDSFLNKKGGKKKILGKLLGKAKNFFGKKAGGSILKKGARFLGKKAGGSILKKGASFLGKKVGGTILKQGAKFAGKRVLGGLAGSALGSVGAGGLAALVGPALLASSVGVGAFKGTQALTKFLAGDPTKKFKDKTTTEKVGTVLSGAGGGFLFDALNKGKTAKFVTVNPNMSIKDLSKAKRILEIQLQGSSLKEDEVSRIKLQIKTAQKFIDRKIKKESQDNTISEKNTMQSPNIVNNGVVSIDQNKNGGLRQDGVKVIQTQAEKENKAIEQKKTTTPPKQPIQQNSPPRQSKGNGVDDLGLTVMNSLVFE